jgi:diguanylate cyclase (GGDEF)-like protein
MELKTYLHILMRMWWVVVLMFFITIIATFIFTANQPRIYESTTTFVVRPLASPTVDRNELATMIDVLSRRVEINTTYAEVAQSDLIRRGAIERLNLQREQPSGIDVLSRVIPGTNILEITVQGDNPELVRDFAGAVSAETIAYVSRLYDAFGLELLDEATLPTNPISPNVRSNLILGGILGLVLGVTWTFFIEYLRQSDKKSATLDIMDPETAAFNHPYLMLRLRQEISRAERNRYSLSLALLKIGNLTVADGSLPWDRAKIMRKITTTLKLHLRDEDVLARYNDETLALIIPDMDGVTTQILVNKLKMHIELESKLSGSSLNYRSPQITAGVATLGDQGMTTEEFIARAEDALQSSTLYSAVKLYAMSSNGYHPDGEISTHERAQE